MAELRDWTYVVCPRCGFKTTLKIDGNDIRYPEYE